MSRLRAWLMRLALLITLCCVGTGRALAEDGTPLRVPTGVTVDNVLSSTEDIIVEGEVLGDVTSWSGAVTVRGVVRGDVVTYAGHVVVEAGGTVHGSIMAPGGGTDVLTDGRVDGQRFGGVQGSPAVARVLALVVDDESPPTAVGTTNLRPVAGVVLACTLLLAALAWPLIWPNRTALGVAALGRLPARSTIVGLLTTLVLALLLPAVLVLLVGSLVGAPVAIALLLLLQVPYLYGLAVQVRWLGGTPASLRRPLLISAALALLIGGVVFVSPPVGALLGYLLVSPGLGAAVLSRFGTLVPARA